MDRFERLHATMARLKDPNTPDNLDVRMALLEKVKTGALTLGEVQKRIRKLKSQRNEKV